MYPETTSDIAPSLEEKFIIGVGTVTGIICCEGRYVNFQVEEAEDSDTEDTTPRQRLLTSDTLPLVEDKGGNIRLDIVLKFSSGGNLEEQLDFYRSQLHPSIEPFGLVEACTRQLLTPPDLVLDCEKPVSTNRSGPVGSTRSFPIYVHQKLFSERSAYFRNLLKTEAARTAVGIQTEEEDSDLEIEESEDDYDGEVALAEVVEIDSGYDEGGVREGSEIEVQGRARSDSPEPDCKPLSKKRRVESEVLEVGFHSLLS
jgi:hypothetical protein